MRGMPPKGVDLLPKPHETIRQGGCDAGGVNLPSTGKMNLSSGGTACGEERSTMQGECVDRYGMEPVSNELMRSADNMKPGTHRHMWR